MSQQLWIIGENENEWDAVDAVVDDDGGGDVILVFRRAHSS